MYRRSTIALLAGLFVAAGSGHAVAQETFPSKPIKMVVPYPPGASTDNMARAFVQELGKELKVPTVIDNRPGGGTTIGALAVRNAPGDGYTLLFQTEGLWSARLSIPNVGYANSDFEIIAPLARTPYTLLVRSSLNARTLDDLKAVAQRNNGELVVGILGVAPNLYSMMAGSLSHNLGVKVRLIPYKGGAEGAQAVMAGDIDVYFATVALASSMKGNERVTVFAHTSARSATPFLPGLRSFADLGAKDMVFSTMYGVAIRSNTPDAVKKKLRAASQKVSNSDELKKAREKMSLESYEGSLDEYVAEVLRDLETLRAATEQRTN